MAAGLRRACASAASAQPTEHAAVARRARIGSAAKAAALRREIRLRACLREGRMVRRNAGERHGRRVGGAGLVCQREGDDAVSCSIGVLVRCGTNSEGGTGSSQIGTPTRTQMGSRFGLGQRDLFSHSGTARLIKLG